MYIFRQQKTEVVFQNRQQAGNLLAQKLLFFRGKTVLVVGLARGGLEIAQVIASVLNSPFDVLVVKKIPSRFDPELAIGALAPDKTSYIHWPSAQRDAIDEDYINAKIDLLGKEIEQKILYFRKGRKPLIVKEKTVILVDDGAATGATLEAAVKWLKKKKTKKIIVALPIAPPEVAAKIRPEVDELIILETPKEMRAVGEFYQEFAQTTDEEVVKLLREVKSSSS